MPILKIFRSCMSRSKPHVNSSNISRIDYDNEKLDVFYVTEIPASIIELLVYIAREGVAVTDLFRRPGNTQHIKRVIHQLKQGETIDWNRYNFYTLANIAKRFLLQVHNGILSAGIEDRLISTLEMSDDQARLEAMSRILLELSVEVRQLLALLFGTWFRMIYHSEVNAMSVEAVAKSVAGSIFPSCTGDPAQVNKASKVMEYLITGFASSQLFGKALIDYFTSITQTSISRIEKFKYEFIYPKNVSKKKSTRLFVRMLLEESYKHGFNVLENEVTEEQFNSIDNCTRLDGAGQPVQMILNGEDHQQQHRGSGPDNGEAAAGDSHLLSSESSQPAKTLLPRKRRISSTHTPPPSLNGAKPLMTSTPLSKTNSITDQMMVQQTSEKRTCVTAADQGSGRGGRLEAGCISATREVDVSLDCVHQRASNSGDADSFPNGHRHKNPRLELAEDVELQQFIIDEMKKLEEELHEHSTTNEQIRDVVTEDLVTVTSAQLTESAAGGRFSRVKKQQMERLKKRSNWFLSPPSGCKNDELIQLSPTSPVSMVASIDLSGSECTEEALTASVAQPQHLQQNGQLERDSYNPDVNDNGRSEDEVEVRYFVVHKYYGPDGESVPLNNSSPGHEE